jgi:nitroreductase
MEAGLPAALIVVCIDWDLAVYEVMDCTYQTVYIDVGTAVENMLLAAHALRLGAWPMTSFSPDAVQVLLNIPAHLKPVMFVGLGYPAGEPASGYDIPRHRIRLEDLVM